LHFHCLPPPYSTFTITAICGVDWPLPRTGCNGQCLISDRHPIEVELFTIWGFLVSDGELIKLLSFPVFIVP